MMFKKQYRSYEFASLSELNTTSFDHLISLFTSKKIEKPEMLLTGRDCVCKTNIEGVGSVIIKHYTRGGFVTYFNKQRYLFSKKRRNRREFEFLRHARKAGVNVPEPFAYVSYGQLFYKAWLITREIANAQNFVELCLKDVNKAIALMPAIGENINKLIGASIHHIDLHPGNIIIDSSNKVFILDFDKACYVTGDRRELKKKYRTRWKRALEKYKFSDRLADLHLL